MQTWSAVHVPGVVSAVAGGLPNNSYTTSFAGTENPISESSVWINGLTDGLDWHDVRKTPGLGFGTQDGTTNFTDSIAILKGTWGNTQTATATVRTINQQTGSIFEEVELLLRGAMSAHTFTGYEFTFSCRPVGDAARYVQMNRWNGTLGSFTLLDARAGPGLNDGDTIKATITGSVLNLFVNNVSIFTYDTSTGNDGGAGSNPGGPDSIIYTSGHPGIGFYNQGGILGNDTDYGFTQYTVSAF